MSFTRSDAALGRKPVAYPGCAGTVTANKSRAPANTVALGDIIELGALPESCELVSLVLSGNGLDSGTALRLEVGLLSGEFGDDDSARDIEQPLQAGITPAQLAAGVEIDLAKVLQVAPSSQNRGIGVKVTTAPQTPAPGSVVALAEYVSL